MKIGGKTKITLITGWAIALIISIILVLISIVHIMLESEYFTEVVKPFVIIFIISLIVIAAVIQIKDWKRKNRRL